MFYGVVSDNLVVFMYTADLHVNLEIACDRQFLLDTESVTIVKKSEKKRGFTAHNPFFKFHFCDTLREM